MLSLTEEELKDHKSVQNMRKVATTNGVQFKFRNFNVKEVTRAPETLNPNKSIGHDKIPPRVLKLWCNVLAPSLTNIFNVCIQTSNWPEQWKRGIWVPLHKKDNHSDITAVTTNTCPQRVFSSVQTCVLVDVNQPLPWFFTRWPREDSFSVSWALGRICRRFSRFCNILLRDLTPLRVKITRRKNLLSVSRRKPKLSTYLHAVSENDAGSRARNT